MTRPIVHVDVPLWQLEAAVQQLHAIRVLEAARLRSASPSDRLAYAFDVDLITEGLDVATDQDFPGWAEHIAAVEAANRQARNALKETL